METTALLRVDFNNMMAEAIGEHGITEPELASYLPMAQAAAKAMEEKRPLMQWRELPHNQAAVVQEIQECAAYIRANFDDFVVLGIGGSALGPIAVHQALNHLRYNDLPKEKRNGPRLFVEDNVDPERMAALLDVIDIRRTAFNVITKSGSTSETMAQLLIAFDLLKKHCGGDYASRVIATTDEKKGNLIKIAKEHNLRTFFIPEGVGGRFSELSPVGLLAAAVCGIDISALLKGAARMDEACSEQNVFQNAAYMAALLQFISMKRGKNISVMMPYADSLKYVSDWYAQLWAESLGKRYDRSGREVFVGQTPVKALGVTDQHSQVQLYVEGPFDKVVTFLGADEYRASYGIPEGFSHLPDVSFLCGHTMNELIKAEQRATEYALMKAGRPNFTISLPSVHAETVGALLYFFEVMTAFAGELLNINAFDQPGVEGGKQATYALLGKPGFDEKRKELQSAPPKNPKYIL
jgi:glucose-6-phosphate isomerase